MVVKWSSETHQRLIRDSSETHQRLIRWSSCGVQVVDEDGNVFTGESENDGQLRGQVRKIELQLDTAQYHLDAQAMAEGIQ